MAKFLIQSYLYELLTLFISQIQLFIIGFFVLFLKLSNYAISSKPGETSLEG